MIEGNGNIGVELGVGGLAISDNRRPVRLFKISSGSNPYAADEVWLNESSGATATTGLYAVTTGQKQLWEVNGNTGVPANTIVEGVPNPAGNGFWFSYQAASTSSLSNSFTYNTSDVTLNQSSGIDQTILTVSISTTGTYLIGYNILGQLNTNAAGDYLRAAFHVSGSIVNGSATAFCYQQVASPPSAGLYGCASATVITSLSSGNSLLLRANRVFTGSVSTSLIYGGASNVVSGTAVWTALLS